jgi:hypothetical protein
MLVSSSFFPLVFSLSSVFASSSKLNLPTSSPRQSYDIPSWQSQNFSCRGSPNAYIIQQSPGKGLGVFATHTLEPGTIIFREAPIILIHPPEFLDGVGYPLSGISQQVRHAFNALPLDKKSEVLGLTAHYTSTEIEQERDDEDNLVPIFRSNAYNSGAQIGLYPKIARINHACRPNTSYFWSQRLGKLVAYASQRIEEGEELSTTYIPLLHTHEDREKRLDQYGFKCGCAACALNKDEKIASDQRRIDIRQAFAVLNPHLNLNIPQSKSGKQKARERAESSLQLVKTVEKEELADYYAQIYRIAAILHARTEDWKPATQFAHKSYQIYSMADEQSEQTMEMQALTSRFIQSWNDDLREKAMLKS